MPDNKALHEARFSRLSLRPKHFDFNDPHLSTEVLECAWCHQWRGTFMEGRQGDSEFVADCCCPKCDQVIAIINSRSEPYREG